MHTTRETIARDMPFVAAVLAFAAGALVAVAVIPQVVYGIPAYWANVAANALLALALVAVPILLRGLARTGVLVIGAVGAVVLGLLLLDAATTPSLQGTTQSAVLFVCVAADLMAGILAAADAVLVRRRHRRESRAP